MVNLGGQPGKVRSGFSEYTFCGLKPGGHLLTALAAWCLAGQLCGLEAVVGGGEIPV